MARARWRDRIGPPLALLLPAVLLAAGSAAATPALAAGLGLDEARAKACAATTPASAARAVSVAPSRAHAARTLTANLDGTGALLGRQLRVATNLGRNVIVELPTESWVADQAGRLVVYARDTSTGKSEVRAIDVESGCDTLLVARDDVVRSAILDPAGDSLYVHAVTRGARADAGVTRHDLSSGRSQQIMPALPASSHFGRTFGTELRWSTDGAALAVQSCGFSQCRTRVLDVTSGHIATFADGGQGAIVGLTSRTVVTWAACHGSPCALLITDRATGAVATIAAVAYSAEVAIDASGAAVVRVNEAAGTREVRL